MTQVININPPIPKILGEIEGDKLEWSKEKEKVENTLQEDMDCEKVGDSERHQIDQASVGGRHEMLMGGLSRSHIDEFSLIKVEPLIH